MKRVFCLMAVFVLMSFVACALEESVVAQPPPGGSYRNWVVGEWRIKQYYQGATYFGTLSIQRERGRFYGRIYFDSLGNWEPLEEVEVTEETLSFYRPLYGGQSYRAHRNGNGMSGHWDNPAQGRWEWRAWRD